jgi:glycosyltransferase involved in cell wall biosynthesis
MAPWNRVDIVKSLGNTGGNYAGVKLNYLTYSECSRPRGRGPARFSAGFVTMKIALFTRYSSLGASSRLRSLQFIPYLESAGFHVTVTPFFDDEYLLNLYAGRRNFFKSLKFYAARADDCMRARDAEIIWLEKELFPWIPWALERMALKRLPPYVVDYDDAVFHRYDYDAKGIAKALLHDKIDQVMHSAACVMAGNSYLSDRARSAGASRIEFVPTVVDTDGYFPGLGDRDFSRVRVGWIGTPNTWRKYAEPVYRILKGSLSRSGASFRAIGASLEPKSEDNFECVPWVEAEEIGMIQSLDIGIMPLQDDPWARGKCGYKLIQYMACGIPVVASPIGVNSEIVEDGVTGFLAETESDWLDAVSCLTQDANLRKVMGDAGRCRVEERYSLQAWAPRVAKLFRSIH